MEKVKHYDPKKANKYAAIYYDLKAQAAALEASLEGQPVSEHPMDWKWVHSLHIRMGAALRKWNKQIEYLICDTREAAHLPRDGWQQDV